MASPSPPLHSPPLPSCHSSYTIVVEMEHPSLRRHGLEARPVSLPPHRPTGCPGTRIIARSRIPRRPSWRRWLGAYVDDKYHAVQALPSAKTLPNPFIHPRFPFLLCRPQGAMPSPTQSNEANTQQFDTWLR